MGQFALVRIGPNAFSVEDFERIPTFWAVLVLGSIAVAIKFPTLGRWNDPACCNVYTAYKFGTASFAEIAVLVFETP